MVEDDPDKLIMAVAYTALYVYPTFALFFTIDQLNKIAQVLI